MNIQAKRIYEQPNKDDGFRVLADRLWPRGVSKEQADIDLWIKELTPSDDLRKAYHVGDISYDEFKDQYCAELSVVSNDLEGTVEKLKAQEKVTLLTAAKDIERSHIPVLKKWLQKLI